MRNNMRLMSKMIVPLILLVIAFAASRRMDKDRIASLPGLGFATPPQYSGFLNATSSRFLHYWMIESQGNPKTDPVIFWFNGGPGCASLTGLLKENGPFHVNQDNKTLFENIYSWNKLGSVVYLEGPTGVGFSYSQHFNDDATNDERTATDFYNAINDFFTNVRPDLQKNAFYMTGESYAGVYIPMTTKHIVDGMNDGSFKGNLTGIAIGNGILSEKLQHNSVVDLLYYHGMISTTLWEKLKTVCCKTPCIERCDFYDNLVLGSNGNHWTAKNTKCGNLSLLVTRSLPFRNGINPYNIYDDCYEARTTSMELHSAYRLWIQNSNNAAAQAASNDQSTDAHNGFSCWGGDARTAFLNRPDVQTAIHIPNALTDAKWKWSACSDLKYARTDRDSSPWLDHIWKNSKVRILIYNGDVDLVCNFLGDQWFMDNFTSTFKIQPLRERGAWWYRGVIGGYVKSYYRVDVATVKGAGHFVPQSRPGPMLQLMANFIRATGNYSQPDNLSMKPAQLTGGVPRNAAVSILSLLCCVCAVYLI